jgi:hypothetical protein
MRSRPLAILILSLTALAAAILATRPAPRTSLRPSPRAGTAPSPGESAIARENPSWWSAAQEEILRQETLPSIQKADALGRPFPDGERAHLVNRAAGFRAYFDARGMELGPRGGAEWSWRLRLDSMGREGAAAPVAPATPSIKGAKVVYERPWGREWYENRPGGIEQLFEVRERPAGTGPLELRMKARGLQATGSSAERVILSAGSRDLVEYGKLAVHDAAGHAVPARMRWDEGAGEDHVLALLVEDAGAKYPLTIDPLATTPAWTAEANQNGAHFGQSVSTAGDVNGDGFSDVIVGASFYDNGQTDEGAAFVFLGSASGLSMIHGWTAEGNQVNAAFGCSVATAGDVNGDGFSDVIVGAFNYDNGETDEGRAWVYLGSASGLSPAPAWSAEGNQVNAAFGCSVATAGDVNGDGFSDVIVGAHSRTNGFAGEGEACVFLGSASGLSIAPVWTVYGGQANVLFGYSVSTAGDVNGDGFSDVIVGAPTHDSSLTDEGRACVFLGSASGLAATPAWNAYGGQAGAYLGNSVSTAGDVNGDGFSDVLVGAPYHDNGQADEGRAYVFLGSLSGPSSTPDWSDESNQLNAFMGTSLSTAGDVNGDGYADIIVGTFAYDNGQIDEGRARVYLGSASGVSPAVWTVESDQVSAQFGFCVAAAGDVNGDGFSDVIVGAPLFDSGHTDEGRAFVFLGSAYEPSKTAAWTHDGGQGGSWFGHSVSTAGDVNGDGFSDVIVGAWWYDNGQEDEGRAFVFLGSASGLSSTPSWTAESDVMWVGFGYSVSTAGDVNGDGFSDVTVGVPYQDWSTQQGQAVVYLGSASGLSATPAWSALGNQPNAHFGMAVSSAGDVNGDGFSDIIVGARDYDNGQTDEGMAFVYLGSASGLSATAAWTAESDQNSAFLGHSVSSAGDVNGDGFSDVLVGIPAYSNGQTQEGRALLFMGSASGLSDSPAWTGEINHAQAYFGYSVSSAGDVDGDGFSDILIGAPGYENGEGDEGGAFVYLGSASGPSATPDRVIEVNQGPANLGRSVSTAGDVNGDGFSDVIVGAVYFNNGQTDEGGAFVYLGSPAGLLPSPAWTAEGNQDGGCFGWSVSTAGDVNGDGFSDVLVGTPYLNRAFVYYGNGGAGLTLRPRILQSDGSTPLHLLGRAASSIAAVRLFGRVPAGRTRARLIVELKPLGTPFDGTGTIVGEWSLLGVFGSEMEQTLLGLSDGICYRWRARIQYFPHMNFTPWFSQGPNGAAETDFRGPDLSAPLILGANSSSDRLQDGDTATIQVVADGTGYILSANFSGLDSGFAAGNETVTDLGGGAYSITYALTAGNTRPDGVYAVPITLTDSAGNASTVSVSLTLDNNPPAAPVILNPTSGTTTSNPTPTISGTAEPDSSVTVTSSVAGALGLTGTNPAGAWSFTPGTPLTPGLHSLTATATDASGNTGAASAAVSITISAPADTTPPAAPVLSSPANNTTTTNRTPVISGTAEANSSVTVTSSLSGPLGVVAANGSGAWTLTPASPIALGTHSLTATATDAAGNTSLSCAPVALTVEGPADTTAPAAPVIVSPSGGTTTTDLTPTISGTAEANSSVRVTSSVDGSLGVAPANASGAWSLTPGTPLTLGAHSLTATATDASGNTGAASAAVAVTVEAAPPATNITNIEEKSRCGLLGLEGVILFGILTVIRRRRRD